MNSQSIRVDDYLLWPDGSISVDPSKVIDFIFKLSDKTNRLFVTSITPDIEAYNSVSEHHLKIKTKADLDFPPKWKLPDHYKNLDLDDYLYGLVEHIEKDVLYDKRVERLSNEIFLFNKLNLGDVLRTLIYSIDVMKEKNVIWGVGRGSSCSSYLLFLLGLHEVDSVKYEIDITDFLN